MSHRIAVGIFKQETNDFVPGSTSLDDFTGTEFARGGDLLKRVGNREMDGFLDAAEAAGVDLTGTIEARTSSGPRVGDAAFEAIVGELCAGIADQLGTFDGVMLGLHGAMATDSHDDAEGEILARVRAIVGPDIPIAASFDLHTHFTARMAANADIVVGYQTCPHVDLRRTGRAAMDILIRTIRGEVNPVVSLRKIPMMTSSETHDDRGFPNSQLIGKLHEAEEDPRILAASAFCTQPWLDVADLGWGIVIVTDAAPDLGQATADTIARHAWSMREHYRVPKVEVHEAIDLALAGDGVFALSEGADSPTAGGAGDGNLLLKALLARDDIDVPCILMVTDPGAAAVCVAAGPGATVTLPLGGAFTSTFYTPTVVTGTVTTITDGTYEKHYGGIAPVSMGPTAVLRIGSVAVMIPSRKPPMVDYRAYLSVGFDPLQAKIVQPKSAGAYREYYEKIATCIDVDLPGPCGSDLPALPYTRIPRPLWPWDPDLEWEPA